MIAIAFILAFVLTPNGVDIDKPLSSESPITANSREKILELERGIAMRMNVTEGDGMAKYRSDSWTDLIDYSGMSGYPYRETFGVTTSSASGPLIAGSAREAMFSDYKRLMSDRVSTCETCSMKIHNLTSSLFDSIDISRIVSSSGVDVGGFSPNFTVMRGGDHYPFYDIRQEELHAYGARDSMIGSIMAVGGVFVTNIEHKTIPKTIEGLAEKIATYDKNLAEDYTFLFYDNTLLTDYWTYPISASVYALDRFYWASEHRPTMDVLFSVYDYALVPTYSVEYGSDSDGAYIDVSLGRWNVESTSSTEVLSFDTSVAIDVSSVGGTTSNPNVSVTTTVNMPNPSPDGGTRLSGSVYIWRDDVGYTMQYDDPIISSRHGVVENVSVSVGNASAHDRGVLSIKPLFPTCGCYSMMSDTTYAMMGVWHSYMGNERVERYYTTTSEEGDSVSNSVERTSATLLANVVPSLERYTPTAQASTDTVRVRYPGGGVTDVFSGAGVYVGSVYGSVEAGGYYQATKIGGGKSVVGSTKLVECQWSGERTTEQTMKSIEMSFIGRVDLKR